MKKKYYIGLFLLFLILSIIAVITFYNKSPPSVVDQAQQNGSVVEPYCYQCSTFKRFLLRIRFDFFCFKFWGCQKGSEGIVSIDKPEDALNPNAPEKQKINHQAGDHSK